MVPWIAVLGGWVAVGDRARSASGALWFRVCNGYAGGAEAVTAVKCPTLIRSGQRDIMTAPRAVQALLKSFRDARLERLPGCGHLMMGERPDETLDRKSVV